MEIYHVTDGRFGTYGKILAYPDCRDMLEVMKTVPIPDAVVYEASRPELEECGSMQAIRDEIFGGMEIQAGFCSGHNYSMNALEYHKCSEVNVAATDLILLLGRQQDIQADDTYETSKLEAFFVPRGMVVEVYATTLHYAPCQALAEGFSWIVILPRGTNTDLTAQERESLSGGKEAAMLFARNKWLIAHREAQIEGAYAGLTGENLKINE